MILAAFALAIGNANARLGWTLDECQNVWGPPTNVLYDSKVNQTAYNFKAGANLFAQVYVLNGHVVSVSYRSRNAKFLVGSVRELLQKNVPGYWTVYDDKRGKKSLMTWQYLAVDTGEVLAYAILWNYPDGHGFYKLQVSSKFWDDYLTGRGADPTNLLNVQTAWGGR